MANLYSHGHLISYFYRYLVLAACLFIPNKCCEQGAEVLQEQDGQPEQASGGVQQPPGRVRQEVRGKFQKIRNAAHGNNFQNFIFRLCKILPLNFVQLFLR